MYVIMFIIIKNKCDFRMSCHVFSLNSNVKTLKLRNWTRIQFERCTKNSNFLYLEVPFKVRHHWISQRVFVLCGIRAIVVKWNDMFSFIFCLCSYERRVFCRSIKTLKQQGYIKCSKLRYILDFNDFVMQCLNNLWPSAYD